jgi:hypothetical protein
MEGTWGADDEPFRKAFAVGLAARLSVILIELENLAPRLAPPGLRAALAMVFRRYSDRFTAGEDAARAADSGLWQTDFEPP